MTKWISVLVIVAMLMPTVNIAYASGGGGGGGGNVEVPVNLAYSKPAGFLAILRPLIIFTIVFATVMPQLFARRSSPPKSNDNSSISSLNNSAAVFLALMMLEALRYQFYMLFNILPYLMSQPANSGGSTTATGENVNSDGVWNASDPEKLATAMSPEDKAAQEQQELIDKAVQKALENPEYVERYAKYASDEIKEAVAKALVNRALKQLQETLKTIPGGATITITNN